MSEITAALAISTKDHLSLQELRSLILETPIKDWTKASGQSAIVYSDRGKEKSELSLFAEMSGKGFVIWHMNRADINDVAYVVEGEPTQEVFEAAFGGDTFEVFGHYVVSKETALKAVEYFMQTGGRLDTLNWQDFEVPEYAQGAKK